jgi:hypothetical protein
MSNTKLSVRRTMEKISLLFLIAIIIPLHFISKVAVGILKPRSKTIKVLNKNV